MRLLGRVKRISHEGYLVVKASYAPNPKDTVFDGRKHRIGRVVRVFGPTRSPYITIKPETGLRALTLVGQELYLSPEGDYGKNKGRDGAN